MGGIYRNAGQAEFRVALDDWRADGRRVAFSNGCFDLLHPGHIESLRRAKAEGDVLVVGLNSDRSVREIKGNGRPIMREEVRAEMLVALEMVDCVVVFDEPTAEEILKVVRPDVFVKAEDCRQRAAAECALVESWGGRIVFHPVVSGWSTTGIIEKVRAER